ncbi:hypothetical protein LINPERHAP2_LOCUS255 [Linum perenne]
MMAWRRCLGRDVQLAWGP